MFKKKKIIGIIPARSGSKGIKNKNMSKINNISLIGHVSKFLNKLNFIDYKVITSDSEIYIKEAKKYGIDKNIKRSKKLSNDKASIVDVLINTLLTLEETEKLIFDYILLLEPTSPLRKTKEIYGAIKLAINNNADCVTTVSELDSKYHPYKIFKKKNNKIFFYSRYGINVINKQQIKNKLFFRNGLCYVINVESLKKNRKIITNNTYPYLVNRNVSDIDSKVDLLWTQFLYENEFKK